MKNEALIPVFLFLSVGSVALFSFVAVAAWADARRKEREAFYKTELLKKLAESSGPGAAESLRYLREADAAAAARRREGMKIGGVINVGVGVGLVALLGSMSEQPMKLVGLIPVMVGFAMLLYVYVLGPKK